MITNRYKYFRWTKRTAAISFVYVFVVPSIVGYLGYKTDVSSFLLFPFPANTYLAWEREIRL